MVSRLVSIFGSLLLLGLALVTAPFGAARAGEDAPATVVLISLDGTRPSDLREEDAPTLLALARRGARARRLLPAFPSYTFPTHVTLVTGVAPEKHGIVGNTFVDAERGLFRKENIPDWIEVEPLWSILARQGIPSASYYWVGSEGPWRTGHGPRFWKPFSSRTPETKKVEQILEWLDWTDSAERPRFITAWFHGADSAAHDHGPGSPEARRALREQEPAIATLVAGLESRGLFESTTLVFVSDHGMAAVEENTDLSGSLADAGFAKGAAFVAGAGGFVSVYLDDPASATGRVLDIARGLGLEAHNRTEAPADWPVGHPRFGDVVVLAPVGKAIFRTTPPPVLGFHGYRPTEESMAGLFIAAGRGVEPGRPPIDLRAIDVAPTVLSLLGVPVPDSMEGESVLPWLAGASKAPGTGEAATGGETQ